MKSISYTAETLRSARELGSATLHEAAGQIGALPSTIKPVHPRWRVAGPAFTVATTPRNNVWIHDALDVAPAGSVIVASVGDPNAGYWGDVMSTAASARGISGVVLDGGARDSDDLGRIDIPVFSQGLSIQGTGKSREPEGALGVQIRIGAAMICPGDLVVGDVDGVVVIPAAIAAATVAKGLDRASREDSIRQRLDAGESTLDIYGWRVGGVG
ncbi:MAG: RraA family protein [Acidimicrobiia bacterium]